MSFLSSLSSSYKNAGKFLNPVNAVRSQARFGLQGLKSAYGIGSRIGAQVRQSNPATRPYLKPSAPSTPAVAPGYYLPGTTPIGLKQRTVPGPLPGTTTQQTQNYNVLNPKTGTSTLARPAGIAAPPTPSSVNTAVSPYSSGSTPTGSPAASNPYADYLAQEAQLIQSGNKQQAIQNSQYLNGTAPTASPTPTAPSTPSSLSDPSFIKKVAQDNLTKLQQQYLSTLTPSEREKALQTQLTDYIGNAKLGISGLEGQGRGIPLNLVRGQQSQLQEQANIGAQTLEGQLTNEQQNRAMQGQVYGTQLGYEQQRLQDEQQQSQQAQNFQVQMLSAGYQQVDPSTVTDPNSVIQIGGQTFLKPSPESKVHEVGGNLVNERGEVIYQGPTAADGADAYTLSPGQVRYDANGNVISSVPADTASKATDAQNKALGFYNRAQAAEADVLNALPNVQNLSQGVLPTLFQGENYKLYKQGADAWIKAVLRQESGAAIPVEEMNSYFKTFFPQVGDTDAIIQQKEASRTQAMNALATDAGGAYQEDPLGLGFKNDLSNTTSQNGSSKVTSIASALKGFKQRIMGSIRPAATIQNLALGKRVIQINSAIANRLAMADAEYFKKTGKHINVSENFRTRQHQQELYNKLHARGAQVAEPGWSMHEIGMAIDVGNDWRAFKPFLNKYGFRNDLPNDRGHFSIGEFG